MIPTEKRHCSYCLCEPGKPCARHQRLAHTRSIGTDNCCTDSLCVAAEKIRSGLMLYGVIHHMALACAQHEYLNLLELRNAEL